MDNGRQSQPHLLQAYRRCMVWRHSFDFVREAITTLLTSADADAAAGGGVLAGCSNHVPVHAAPT